MVPYARHEKRRGLKNSLRYWQRCMNQSAMEIDFESLIQKCHCDKPCPSFWVVPMIMTNDYTSAGCVRDFAQSICTKALENYEHVTSCVNITESSTCEAWMIIRSFIRPHPASILPRNPKICVSKLASTFESQVRTCCSKFNAFAFEI